MITVESYNLYYSTQHLLSPKPKTYKEIIDRLDPLPCSLFYNVISSPQCRYESRFAEGRIKEHYKNMDAESRFKNIFTEKIIYANPKGYFVNKSDKIKPSDCEDIKSVSFTLSDYRILPKHFEARGSEYAICFFHDFLQNRGLRPVEYLNENDAETNKKLVFNSPHLIEVCSPNYDMKWENEWRIKSDLHFTEDDIAFVIVPQEKHEEFVEWFMDNDDFSSMQILSSSTYTSYVDALILYPQQTDNNWRQVEIFRDKNGSGLKVDPKDLNSMDRKTRDEFSISKKIELSCFAKNSILLNYEYAYTTRFLRFADKLTDHNRLGGLFQDYDTIKENLQEPEDAQRDLILGLFGDLYTHHS